jgi:hypothetical protein
VLALGVRRTAVKKGSDGEIPSGAHSPITKDSRPGKGEENRQRESCHRRVERSAATFWEKASRAITPRS